MKKSVDSLSENCKNLLDKVLFEQPLADAMDDVLELSRALDIAQEKDPGRELQFAKKFIEGLTEFYRQLINEKFQD